MSIALFALGWLCRRLRAALTHAWLSWRLATIEAQMHYLAEEAAWFRDTFELLPVDLARYRVQLAAMQREREQLLQRRAAL